MSVRMQAVAGGLPVKLFEKSLVVAGVDKPFYKEGLVFPDEWFGLVCQVAEQAYKNGRRDRSAEVSRVLKNLLDA